MTIQGTSTKIHFIPIGVYLAILIIHIKESAKFWARGGESSVMSPPLLVN